MQNLVLNHHLLPETIQAQWGNGEITVTIVDNNMKSKLYIYNTIFFKKFL